MLSRFIQYLPKYLMHKNDPYQIGIRKVSAKKCRTGFGNRLRIRNFIGKRPCLLIFRSPFTDFFGAILQVPALLLVTVGTYTVRALIEDWVLF